MSDRELTDNEGPPDVIAFSSNCTISKSFAAAGSSLEGGEMVYNIAQAKISKMKPDKNDRQRSLNSNFNNRKFSHLNSFNGLHTLEQSSSKSNLSLEKHPNKGLHKQSVSKIAKPIQTKQLQKTKSLSNSVHRSSTAAKMQLVKCYPRKNNANDHSGVSSLFEKANTLKQVSVPNKKLIAEGKEPSTPVKPPRQATKKATNREIKESKIPKACKRQSSLPRRCKLACSPRSVQFEKPKSSALTSFKNNNCSSSFSSNHPNFSHSNSYKTNKTKSDVASSLKLSKIEQSFQQEKSGDFLTSDNQIEHASLDPIYDTSSEEFAKQTERPDPVGCAFDCQPVINQQSLGTSFLNPTYSHLKSDGIQHFHQRPDSMIVNVDKNDNHSQDCNLDDNDAVDVNFYCLTFTTRNPLVPLSKRKFHQQIKNNIKRKSITKSILNGEISEDFCYEANLATTESNLQFDDLDKKSIAYEKPFKESNNCNETIPIDNCGVTSFCRNSRLTKQQDYANSGNSKATTTSTPLVTSETTNLTCSHYSEEGTSFSDEENSLAADSGVIEMPKLEYHYSSNTNRRTKSADASLASLTKKHSQHSLFNSPHHEVCLYDSNSLAISYVSTRQSCSSSSESASRSNTSSPSTNKRDDSFWKNDVMKQSSRPVLMSKSISKEGPRLTLVKKQKRTGEQTLELLITSENDTNKKKFSSINGKTKQNEQSPCGRSLQLHPEPSNSELTSQETRPFNSRKKAKWSGLKRFSAKKNAKETKQTTKITDIQKSKTSLVSKILPSKTKSGTGSNSNKNFKEKIKSPNKKIFSQTQTKCKSKASTTSSNNFSRTNLR